MRTLAIAGAVAGLAAILLIWRPWSSNMSARAVERALPTQIRTEYPRLRSNVRFRCTPIHNDGSIAMSDVDYQCDPVGGGHDSTGFWVGTNRHRITELQPMG